MKKTYTVSEGDILMTSAGPVRIDRKAGDTFLATDMDIDDSGNITAPETTENRHLTQHDMLQLVREHPGKAYTKILMEGERMRLSEAIRTYYDDIREELVNSYRIVLESDGKLQRSVYVWEDGEIEVLEDVQGSNSWLQPRRMETRKLFFVKCVAEPCFCWCDLCNEESIPDGEEERETLHRDAISWAVEDFEERLDDLLDTIIKSAKLQEEYETAF